MVYKYKYQTPNGFSDILMNSDGKYLRLKRYTKT